jgi:antitoxin CptB
MPMDALLGERELSKLKWRCRRGLLENDLFVARFFQAHESTLTVTQATGLQVLMDLADNDLLDLLLRRKEPPELAELGDFAQAAEVHEVLALMRCAPLAPN